MKNIIVRASVLIGSAVLLLIVGANLIIASQLNNKIEAEQAAIEEKLRPAEIEIISIVQSDCEKCTKLDAIVAFINGLKINTRDFRQISSSDEEAKEIISRHEITKLPTLVISGEIKKDEEVYQTLLKLGEEKNEAIVVTQYDPPYFDLVSEELRGETSVTYIIDRNCDDCYDPTVHEESLERFGMREFESQVIDVNTEQAKAIIEAYDITAVPTFVVRGDVEEYTSLLQVWPQVGRIVDGALVFDQGVEIFGGYIDLETGKFIKKNQQLSKNYQNLTSTEFSNMITTENVTILDVRTPEEYAEGHIEGSILIPLDELEKRLSELNPEEKIMVYCHSGNRSAQASEILAGKGFNQVYNLEKGIVQWIEKGYPIVK